MPLDIRNRTNGLPKAPDKRYRRRVLSSIDTIVVHHSGTEPGRDDSMAFAGYHVRELGWPGIGYHYVIRRDGTVEKVNALSTISYHAQSANTRSVGICLVGSFDDAPPPGAQLKALKDLCGELRQGIPTINRVIGHREVPGTEKSCPGSGFDMASLRKSLRLG